MKIVFVGGGSHRLASVSRGLLASAGLNIREIALHDIDRARAGLMAEFIRKTPEYRRAPCVVSWDQTLDEALDGADLVNVIVYVSDPLTLNLMNQAAARRGFMSLSWVVCPGAAIRAVKVCSVVMDVARRMERLCPDAWLLDFANPVPVVSGAVNHHTRIRGYGICEGFTNHLWDISRLFGRDEPADGGGIDIHCAGVNHFSFISPESVWKGRKLHDRLDELLAAGRWSPPEFSPARSEVERTNTTQGLEQLLLGYRRYGRLLFSSEADGLGALNVAGFAEARARAMAGETREDAAAAARAMDEARRGADRAFADFVRREMDDRDWENLPPGFAHLAPKAGSMMVLMARARAGETVKVVSSVPNGGAIRNIPDRFVVEFSQVFEKGRMRPSIPHALPDVLFAWVAAFAAHHTLLADAIALDSPETFVRALSCHPVRRDGSAFWGMWRELLEISRDELSPNLRKTADLISRHT